MSKMSFFHFSLCYFRVRLRSSPVLSGKTVRSFPGRAPGGREILAVAPVLPVSAKIYSVNPPLATIHVRRRRAQGANLI